MISDLAEEVSVPRSEELATLPSLLTRLAQAHRVLAAQGHADGTLGHVSLRDPYGRGFWLKRSDIGMDEVSTQEDLLLVDFSGVVLAGEGGLHSEWPIHAAPMIADTAIQSVVHTHARAASLLSAADLTVTPLTSEGGYLGAHPVDVYRAAGAHIDDLATAREMVGAMGNGLALLIRNHGIVTRGASLELATLAAMFLERAAELQLRAMCIDARFTAASPDEVRGRTKMLESETFLRQNFDQYVRKLGNRPVDA